MPTFAKLAGAILFAALGWATSFVLIELHDFTFPTPWLAEVNAALGLILGWSLAGPRAGGGVRAGLANGLSTGAVLAGACVFLWACQQMLESALAMRMNGPSEAVRVVAGNIVELGGYLMRPEPIALLVVGSLVAGLVVEALAERRRA